MDNTPQARLLLVVDIFAIVVVILKILGHLINNIVLKPPAPPSFT